MKKNYYLVLFVVLLSISAKAQTNWINVKLDEKIAVKFPSEPEKKTGNGSVSYVLKTKDSITYTAAVIDYKIIANLDSATLVSIKDTRSFADQIKTGIASQRKNYSFEDIKIGKWKTFTSYSIVGTKTTNKSHLSMKMVLIGSKMYACSCLVPEQLSTKDNEIFLDSAELLFKQ